MSSFPYKKVLLIGATSGIGRALAIKMLQNGVSVVAVGRRTANLDSIAAENASASGKISTATFDVSKLSEIPQFAKDITSQHPDIDCVHLNSGLQYQFDWTKPGQVDLDKIDQEVLLNYTSYIHLAKAFLQFLAAQAPKPTGLIFTTSGLALLPLVTAPNYSATKAALHHHILAMRAQLQAAKSNVRIIELYPPAVQTELHDAELGQEKGRAFGMPLNDFVEEAWAGLCKDGPEGEQVAVQIAKTIMGFDSWEQERQKGFVKMNKSIGI